MQIPGEYTTKVNGRPMRWRKAASGQYVHEGCSFSTGEWVDYPIAPEDLDAAYAARAELIEAVRDAEQWVELPVPSVEARRMRVRAEGRPVHYRCSTHDWRMMYPSDADDHASVQACRKGREVKEAEDAELREQVKALVGAVQKMPTVTFTHELRQKPESAEAPCFRYETTGKVDVDGAKELAHWALRVSAAAKAVKL